MSRRHLALSQSLEQFTEKSREQTALQLAQRHGGKLTVPVVAAETELSLDEAQALLDDIARKGYAGQVVNPGGFVEYHFFGLTTNVESDTPAAKPAQQSAAAETNPPIRHTETERS